MNNRIVVHYLDEKNGGHAIQIYTTKTECYKCKTGKTENHKQENQHGERVMERRNKRVKRNRIVVRTDKE